MRTIASCCRASSASLRCSAASLVRWSYHVDLAFIIPAVFCAVHFEQRQSSLSAMLMGTGDKDRGGRLLEWSRGAAALVRR